LYLQGSAGSKGLSGFALAWPGFHHSLVVKWLLPLSCYGWILVKATVQLSDF